MAKVQSQKERGQNRPIKTWYRRCAIHPDFVGHTFNVHNGKAFLPVFVTENMVGHKLGEGGLVPLAMRRRAGEYGDLPSGVDPDQRAFP